MSYPIPPDEGRRLKALAALRIDPDTPQEELSVLVRMAARSLDAPISLVSLLDEGEQHFAARHPLTMPPAIPRRHAFCTYTILDDAPLVVPDARQDTRFADNPLVTGPLSVRAYAGVPLEVEPGQRAGALCVLDSRPRAFTVDDLATLSALGQVARRLLVAHREKIELADALIERDTALAELSHRAAHCELTGLLQPAEFRRRAERLLAAEGGGRGLALMDLDGFKAVNDTYGHAVGDAILAAAGAAIATALPAGGLAGRMGGDEFAILAPTCGDGGPGCLSRTLRAELHARLAAMGHGACARISIGIAEAAEDASFAALFHRADTALYSAKATGRDRTCTWHPGIAALPRAPGSACA